MQSVENLKGSAAALWHLESLGFRLWDTSDPAKIRNLIDLSDKKYLTATLDSLSNDFTSNNCIWLVLLDKSDTVCALAGIRVDDIPQDGWVSFWSNHYQRTSPDDTGIIDTTYAPPVVSRMSGRCAYVGDMWLKTSAKVDILSFAILIQSIAVTQFMADWIYSFIREPHARKGQLYNLRLANSVPSVHRWLGEPAPQRSNSDWLLSSSKEDAAFAIKTYREAKQSEPKPLQEPAKVAQQQAAEEENSGVVQLIDRTRTFQQ